MNQKTSNPAPLAAGRALEMFSCVAAGNDAELTPSQSEIQSRRAVWIARRYAVPLTMANTIAALFFGEASHV